MVGLGTGKRVVEVKETSEAEGQRRPILPRLSSGVFGQQVRQSLKRTVQLNGFGESHGPFEHFIVEKTYQPSHEVTSLARTSKRSGLDVGRGRDVQRFATGDFTVIPQGIIRWQGVTSAWVVGGQRTTISA